MTCKYKTHPQPLNLRRKLGCILIALSAAAWAQADTFYVNGACGDDAWTGAIPACQDPDGPKATIQAAIDAAANGDEIIVAPGTYFEAINFLGKAITVRSSHGPQVTTIDGNGNFHVVQCVSGEGSETVLDGFVITGGNAYGDEFPDQVGGGMYNVASSPTVTNCSFFDNDARKRGGGMHNEGSSPTVTNCSFISNDVRLRGGGMYNEGSSPTVTNCSFIGNRAKGGPAGLAGGNGGGMSNFEGSNPTVTNCSFIGNFAERGRAWGGGGISGNASSPTVTNCTFSGNSGRHGGISGNATVANCIFWGDSPDEIGDGSTVTFSNIQGGWEGTGNIDADPLFVDPDNGDYHLADGSPCIDKGDPAYVWKPGAGRDMDGQMRIWNKIVDMGADEYGSFVFGDTNCDGSVDLVDVEAFVLALLDEDAYGRKYPDCDVTTGDANLDGSVDLSDVEAFIELLLAG